MKKALLILLLILTTTLPALAAPTNTSGPWGIDASGFKKNGFENLSTALSSPATVGKTVVVSKPMAINNKTVTGNRLLKVIQGGRIDISAGKTLAFAPDSSFDAGEDQAFGGDGTVTGLKKAILQWFGAIPDDAVDDTIALQAAAIAAPHLAINGQYLAASTVTFALNDVELSGRGTIKASGNGYTMLKFTALRPKLYGITVEGSATEAEVIGQTPNQSSLRKALIEINGEALTERQGAVIDGVRIRNAFETGLFLYKTVDAKVYRCTVVSTQTDNLPIDVAPFVEGIYSYSSAILTITNNTVYGYGEGLVVGTDGITSIDIFDGTVSSIYTRKIVISDNVFNDQADHSVYMSNFCSEYSIVSNDMFAKTYPSLKVEGDSFAVEKNRVSQGITTRHVKGAASISGNIITIKSGSDFTYGILLYTDILTVPSYTGTDRVTIDRNEITCDAGVQAKAGIMVQGSVNGATQRVLSNISISGNVIKGFGYNVAEGAGIMVQQQLIATNPVTGAKARNIHVTNNIIEMADVSALGTPNITYGISLMYGIENAIVSGNTVAGYTSMGLQMLGVFYAEVSGNIFASKAVTGIATRYGIYERANDTALHYNSDNNKYSPNVWAGDGNAINVQRANQGSIRTDIIKYYATLSGDNSYDPPRYAYDQIYLAATTTGRTYTLSATGWWLHESCTIYNVGANAFTVTNGAISKSVAAGSNITFVHIGGGAFITDK